MSSSSESNGGISAQENILHPSYVTGLRGRVQRRLLGGGGGELLPAVRASRQETMRSSARGLLRPGGCAGATSEATSCCCTGPGLLSGIGKRRLPSSKAALIMPPELEVLPAGTGGVGGPSVRCPSLGGNVLRCCGASITVAAATATAAAFIGDVFVHPAYPSALQRVSPRTLPMMTVGGAERPRNEEGEGAESFMSNRMEFSESTYGERCATIVSASEVFR